MVAVAKSILFLFILKGGHTKRYDCSESGEHHVVKGASHVFDCGITKVVDGRLVVVGRQEGRDSSYLLLKYGVTRLKMKALPSCTLWPDWSWRGAERAGSGKCSKAHAVLQPYIFEMYVIYNPLSNALQLVRCMVSREIRHLLISNLGLDLRILTISISFG